MVFVVGCAHQKPAANAPVAATVEEPHAPHGSRGATEPIALPHHVAGKDGAPVDDARLAKALADARVIYVGEEHPNPHHHAAQLEVLEAAYAADPSIGVGLEMLPRTMQASLDAFVAGTLDEAGFLAAVDWKKTWGFPFGFYRPLLVFCRDHHLRAWALNAPRAITHAIAHDGIETLTPEQKRELPELVPGPEPHREQVREAFGAHPHGKFSEAQFERFYTAQLVWDETMADSVSKALAGPSAPHRLLVIAGAGHTRRFAIPLRATRRGAGPALTILPLLDTELSDALKDAPADLFWVLETT
jgi:uncharacterized iron-regulated protein